MSGFNIIGTVTATEQFAVVIFKTIKLVKSVINHIQDAPIQIQQRVERLESLTSLTEQILSTKSLQTERISMILSRCESRVQSLQNLIQKSSFESHNSITLKTWRAIFSLKEEENILKMFDLLDQEFNSLNTHINLHILAMAEDIQTGYTSIDTKLNTIAQAANSSPDSLKCLQALFITDPATDRAKLINSKGELVQGTCDWIAQKHEFVKWRASDGGLLWISGGPGLGKTMLSIYLTEYLSSCFLSPTDGKLIKRELIGHILPSYEVQKEQLFLQNSFETVWEFFLEMMNDLGESQTTCILDGLDECEPISLGVLLKSLKNITSISPRLKIIVLSREYPQCLGASLSQFPRIRLDPDARTEVNRGLEQYISTRVAELSESKQYPNQLTIHVKETLRKKSAGTYLWVSFTVKDLQTMEISEVEQTLNQLPQGLDGLYEGILQQIEGTQRGITLDILRWCAFAVRPLSFSELATALDIKSTGILDRATILREKLAHCGHFLNITNNTATLVHHSAYDFLTRQIPNPEAMPWFSLSNVELEQSKLASACISYFYDVYCKDRDAFQVETQGVKVLADYPNFFSDESELLQLWTELEPHKAKESYYAQPLRGQAELAANYGLSVLMERALRKQGLWRFLKDLFSKSRRSKHLQIATAKGHIPTLERIIKNKARALFQQIHSATRLYIILLENGARVDCETNAGNTPLELVKLLLESGAALHIACRRGDMPAIRTLLDPKWTLDVNRQDQGGNTALHWAAMEGKLEAVKLLLIKPTVDPKSTNQWGLSPFYLALFHCRSNVAKYLYMMRNGKISPLEPNEKCGWGAIHLVIIGKSWDRDRPVQKMLQLLLVEFGVDPELRTPKAKCLDDEWHNHHFSPQDGGLPRHAGIAQSMDPEDFCYETLLSLAIKRGCVGVVDYLLADCKIDPNAPCRGCDGASPLHVAAQSLRDDIVQRLTSEWKVDVNCLDNRQRTPLHSVVSALAFYKRQRRPDDQVASRNRIIQILIEAGAQISVMDKMSFQIEGGSMDRGDAFDSIAKSSSEINDQADTPMRI
ncbi:ankyrin repeat-containing domain protein [Trichoderma velutinum]